MLEHRTLNKFLETDTPFVPDIALSPHFTYICSVMSFNAKLLSAIGSKNAQYK